MHSSWGATITQSDYLRVGRFRANLTVTNKKPYPRVIAASATTVHIRSRGANRINDLYSAANNLATQLRSKQLFEQDRLSLFKRVDKMFLVLLYFEWALATLIAIALSPQTWDGPQSFIHFHVIEDPGPPRWRWLPIGGPILPTGHAPTKKTRPAMGTWDP